MPDYVAISMGDYNGIGPEVILKILPKIQQSSFTPVILGNGRVFEFYGKQLDLSFSHIHTAKSVEELNPDKVNILQCVDDKYINIAPGTITKKAGEAAMQAIKKGIALCLNQQARALITAPISKEAVNRAGYHIPGHTEFLAEQTNADQHLMLLVNKELRVGLVTTHIPVSNVAKYIQPERILVYIKTMHRSLNHEFGIENPKIAVLGLNPHAGDGGIIGDEEIAQIIPAIEQAQVSHIQATGPHPADGFFGNQKYKNYDGILAMYHDQGLIPFKTLSFGKGVNVTGGLPIVRTSPDHGTAFDIAAEGKANPSSLLAAYRLACTLSKNRR